MTVDFEKSRSWLVWYLGKRKTATCCFLGSILGSGSQFYLVDGQNELQALSNVHNVPLESRRSFLCSAMLAQMNGEDLGKKNLTKGTFRTQGMRWDDSMVVAIDGSGFIVASAPNKEKQAVICLLR